MKSIPREVIGISILSIRSRIHAPVALNSRLQNWESYSDDELRLLLRFAAQGYETMLTAADELKATIAKEPAKRRPAKKSRSKS